MNGDESSSLAGGKYRHGNRVPRPAGLVYSIVRLLVCIKLEMAPLKRALAICAPATNLQGFKIASRKRAT